MQAKPTITIDIVSDVVCPWCIIGYRYLQQAMDAAADKANFQITWNPFELNPQMPPEGQNLREHIMQKYGTTVEQSVGARQRLTSLGTSLGFTFNYTDESRMINTFKAHQLLHWAGEEGKQTDLKEALFAAYFTHQRDIYQDEVLADAAAEAGLDRDEALTILADGRNAQAVRAQQELWLNRGIHAVPAYVYAGKYALSGAQDASVHTQVINRILTEQPAEVGA